MLRLERLRTLNMEHPLGIDEKPYFSWVLNSDASNTMQISWELTIKEACGAIVWETGRVESRESTFVEYAGPPLKSCTAYEWSVTVRDNHGSEASASSSFETAYLELKEWGAEWVKSPFRKKKSKLGFGKQGRATLFRRDFKVTQEVSKARIYATCHGIYRFTVNGLKAGEREFAPEHTSYEKYLCYQTYDITDLLRKGENTVGIHVGDGWYCGNMMITPKYRGYENIHAVLFQIEIEYVNGETERVCSDNKVKAEHGPVMFSNLFSGEKYDSNYEPCSWDSPGFNASGWKKTKLAGYGYKNLKAQLGGPVKAVKLLKPVSNYTSPRGDKMIDFGQNIAGRLRVKIDIPKGAAVTFEHSEVTDKNGNYLSNLDKKMPQKVEFVSSGKCAEYEPLFTYHGFRYVKITGIDDINPDDFKAVVLSSENENLGTFSCSDDRLNRLYENTRWSQLANMISIPTDCPQREKAGWTGDIQVYCKTALLNEDITAFLTRWLDNLSHEQHPNGAVPMIVPFTSMYRTLSGILGLLFGNKGAVGVAGWGDAAVIVPWTMYRVTGNLPVLKRQYKSMKHWCDYIIETAQTRRGKTRKIKKEADAYLWNTGFHYGEWLIPSQSEDGLSMTAFKKSKISAEYTTPIMGWYSISVMAETCSVLGREKDCEYYSDIAGKMEKAIGSEVVASYTDDAKALQGAYVLPLFFDLVPADLKPLFISSLVELIENNGNCLDTGFLGTPYILDALSKCGKQDKAYQLLLQTENPSWLYAVEHGATTIWESWEAFDSDGEPLNISFNHYAFGCVDDWMFRNINGINLSEPGFRHIVIKPQPAYSSLSWAKRTYLTGYGTVSSDWRMEDDEFILSVKIPCNTTATIIMPDGAVHETGSGEHSYRTAIKEFEIT